MILFVFCKCELHKKFQLVSLLSWHSKGGAIGRQSPLAGIAHLLLKAGATIYCGSGGGSWPHPCVLSGACMWHKFTHTHRAHPRTHLHTHTVACPVCIVHTRLGKHFLNYWTNARLYWFRKDTAHTACSCLSLLLLLALPLTVIPILILIRLN